MNFINKHQRRVFSFSYSLCINNVTIIRFSLTIKFTVHLLTLESHVRGILLTDWPLPFLCRRSSATSHALCSPWDTHQPSSVMGVGECVREA